MGFPTGYSAAAWRMSEPIRQAGAHLCELFEETFPEAAALAADDPIGAIGLIPQLELRIVDAPPKGACSLGALYEDRLDPPRITIRASGSPRRDNFTLLHEVGHHLLAADEIWQYDVRPTLDAVARRQIEEDIVNSFAAEILIPQEAVDNAFQGTVSASSIWILADHCQASLAACCVRAANYPGDRLVLVAYADGRVQFAVHGGGPYPPKPGVTQPSLAIAADRAAEDEAYSLLGSHGIVYANGSVYTDVRLDVHRRGEMIVCVAASTRPDLRIRGAQETLGDCGRCGSTFPASESTGICARCDCWKCPDCHTCECSKRLPICDFCCLELSAIEAQSGLKRHRECM